MRRLLLSLFAIGFSGLFAGCCHTRGVCDCETDNYCASRAPWVQHGEPPAGAVSGTIPITPPRSLPTSRLD